MAHVRDRPSLRESIEIVTPSGKRYRWADDEHQAQNVPSGERFSDTMPGGFAEHDAVLPRKASVDYSDLERLSTVTRYDASGGIIWQGRLERAPKVSGDQMAISPSAVGWQAHLEDNKSASMVFVDRDLSRWRGPSATRQLALNTAAVGNHDFEVRADATSGAPVLATAIRGAWTSRPISEAWYDAGPGNLIGRIRSNVTEGPNVNAADANWEWRGVIYQTDASGGPSGDSGNLRTAGDLDVPATAEARFAAVWLFYGAAGGTDNSVYDVMWSTLRVVGDHGLSLAGSGVNEGVNASEVVAYAVGRWAPLLTATANVTVSSSSFSIGHLAFHDPTTAGEMIRQVTRFGLQDWAVWDDKVFWWHDRGARGRKWRARVREADLEETGPQVDRLWESIIVQYQDVDGSTRTVGSVGSGADTETDDLRDDDPENPANKLGIKRRGLLVMGVGTAASATEVGRRFLEESKLLDNSGRARLVGHVEDDRGVWHPYSHIRAGDMISFVDSSDTSYRRIVRTDKNRDDRSCSLDLDAPPEGLAALLERLGVVLVPLGL